MKHNIAYLLNSSHVGGGNLSMLTLWKGLKNSPVKPIVFYPSSGPVIELVKRERLHYYVQEYFQPSWTQPMQTYFNRRLWTKHIKENGVSLVHANDFEGARCVVQATNKLRIPLLCHIRFPRSKDYLKWVFRNLPKPQGFIFCSKALQKDFGPALQRYYPGVRQWVVHNGVDLSKFDSIPINRNGKPGIGIIANLQPIKGHEDFIRMASLLIKKKHDVLFEVIGDDVQQSGRMAVLKDMILELGLAERFTFHGYVQNVASLIKELDIVVCSSHVEPLARCIIESMACGKPVVATRVGGTPEVVVEDQTGLMVPPKSPEKLAKCVETLLDDTERKKKMGLNGRDRVEKFFSMERHAQAIQKIYDAFL